MATAEQAYLRSELHRRHDRLQSALRSSSAEASLSLLLDQVDAALTRMEQGTYGICKACHTPIETDRLLADPLLQFCLDDLTHDERRALESDLTLAARIQQALLPNQDFSPVGWQVHYHYAPAGLVSGDYCDLFESKSGLLFLLGDVSGKGIAASMLMSTSTQLSAASPILICLSIAWWKPPTGFSPRAPWQANMQLSLWAARRAMVRSNSSAPGISRFCTSATSRPGPRAPLAFLSECSAPRCSPSIASLWSWEKPC
jgi:RNA polymerase-binding transcription factor DksA